MPLFSLLEPYTSYFCIFRLEFLSVFYIFAENSLSMEIIERPKYLNYILSLLGRDMIIILVGQHRVGKSYMLKQLQN